MLKANIRRTSAWSAALAFLLFGLGACGLTNAVTDFWPPPLGGADGGVVVTDGGVCADGEHNGGDGVCVPETACSNGYLLEENGRCARWEVLTDGLSPARALVTVVPLTQGRWLAVGGRNGSSPVGDAWLFDPDDGWAQSNSGIRPRYGHVAAPLAGNRVVVVGGIGDGEVFEGVAEIYRADQDSWSELGTLQRPRIGHVALEVGNGKFWAVGGMAENDVVLGSIEELSGGEWRTLSLALDLARTDFPALLIDGLLYVFGGTSSSGAPLRTVEQLDPANEEGTTLSPMTDPRAEHTATLLEDGRVLTLGGLTDVGGQRAVLATSEYYNPADDSWTAGPRMRFPRYGHTVVALDTGNFLVVGGFDNDDNAVSAVELFDPEAEVFTEAAAMSRGRGHAAVVPLDGESAMVINGSSAPDDMLPVVTVERYDHP